MRFINGAANTFYDVRIPGLELTVVQADGVNVEPVTVDEFRFGPGETYDVLVQPKDDAYTIYAQAMDRTGYARGTLATHAGLEAPVPALDPVEWLTMGDMMGVTGCHGWRHGRDESWCHGSWQYGWHEPRQYGGDGSWRNGGSWCQYRSTPRQDPNTAQVLICG